MYCKYCGAEIEEGSKFCRQCGVSLDSTQLFNHDKSFSNKRFKSISRIGQSAILVYILWLLIIASYVLANSDEENFKYEVLFPSLNFAIILPFAFFVVYYIFKIYSKKENAISSKVSESNSQKTVRKSSPIFESSESSPLVKVYMLVDFARKKGHMQVIKTNNDTATLKSYCQFKFYSQITIVEFSGNIGYLSSIEISEKKSLLCVKEYKNGRFELDYLSSLNENDVMLLYR